MIDRCRIVRSWKGKCTQRSLSSECARAWREADTKAAPCHQAAKSLSMSMTLPRPNSHHKLVNLKGSSGVVEFGNIGLEFGNQFIPTTQVFVNFFRIDAQGHILLGKTDLFVN